jgi:hypothetical protein
MMPPDHSFLQAPLLRHAGQALELRPQPVRLVVPSQSLRMHVGAALVRHLGRSVVGVSVQTLYGLAVEIVNRAEEPIHRGEPLVPILVRQQARQAAVLRAALDDLVEGYAAVGATVADLLDAGFTGIHAEVLDELLAQHAGAPAAVSRARALVRVTAGVAAALTHHGLGRSSTLLQRAREIVERDGLAALPARAVLIHGFADATGVATDLIETVLRHCGGRIYVDHPPDPAMPARVDLGAAFTRRFVERLGAATAAAEGAAAAPQLRMIGAPGADAEVRAVAQHIRNAIDQGVRPESIAIVSRDLSAYMIPLRVQLQRLGIPFSALGARGPITAAGRRLQALLDLLARKEDATTDRWLDVLGLSRLTGTSAAAATSLAADLRLGLRACGAARVHDVATLDVAALLAGRRALPLPVRHGLSTLEDDRSPAPQAVPVAPRRALRADILAQAIEAACAFVARWAAWPAATDLRAHVAQLRDLLTTDLAWSPTVPAPAAEVFAALATLDRDVSPDIVPAVMLSTEDFALLLRNTCTDIGTPPLGGQGGGVQVLSVVEARARTWEHLFIVGLNRDVFPRTVREDPLLPDALRRALASVLPDIPIKQLGFDEERYLFAQLLAASPHVTLSWQTIDDEGKPHAASPLIERLRLARPDIPVQSAPGLNTPLSDHSELRTPHEHALLAGLYGARTSLPDIWQVAIAHTQHTADPRALANARIAVLKEQDPRRRGAPHLGPYFGFIGAPREPADPRRAPLYVTTLERMAGCPWQTFVRRLLAIEPPPDPLAALPTIDALLIGSTVHRVLERIVGDAVATGPQPHLAAVVTPATVQVAWPDSMRLQHLLQAAAAEGLRDAGIGLAGLAPVLAQQAQPYLEEARRLDWTADGVPALGAEVEGVFMLRDDDGREREVRFRADRVDAIDGAVRLTDYKTGAPVSQAKTAKTRRAHFLRDVESGKRLQAVAYVLGARAAGAVDAEGRYLFLTPDLDDAVRRVSIGAADVAEAAAFDRAARTVLQAWDAGSFFPRLTEASADVEPRRCAVCDVAPACLRRDSGARARLRQWAAGDAGTGASAAERALLALWYLGQDTDTVSEGTEA